jgi:hypothetical protein
MKGKRRINQVPERQDNKGVTEIGWTTITKSDNTASNYVYTHQEDKEYIIHWFNRFSSEVDQIRKAEPEAVEYFDVINPKLPKSGIFHEPRSEKHKVGNSINSYIGGCRSNFYRSNIDFTKKQLKEIIYIFNNYIQPAFSTTMIIQGVEIFKTGWDHTNNCDYEPPLPIKFRQY